MHRILLIGVEEASEVHEAVVEAGFTIRTTPPDSFLLREAFEEFRPEAMVLALGEDVFLLHHVHRLLRTELNAHPVPILALARPSHLEPAQLVAGVDDFVLPPYCATEVLARIQLLFWRNKRVNAQHLVQCGGLVMDIARRCVTAEGTPIGFTVREYQLLQFLMTNRSRAFTRESLLSQVWGYQFEGDVRVVDAYVKRVRAKLPEPYGRWVETVRGVGYRLRDPA